MMKILSLIFLINFNAQAQIVNFSASEDANASDFNNNFELIRVNGGEVNVLPHVWSSGDLIERSEIKANVDTLTLVPDVIEVPDGTMKAEEMNALFTNLNNYVIANAYDYICQEVIYKQQTTTTSSQVTTETFYSSSQRVTFFNPISGPGDQGYNFNFSPDVGTFVVSPPNTSLTYSQGGFTYGLGNFVEQETYDFSGFGGGTGISSHFQITRTGSVSTTVCGTPVETNRVVCYPRNESLPLTDSFSAIDINSASGFCPSDDEMKLVGDGEKFKSTSGTIDPSFSLFNSRFGSSFFSGNVSISDNPNAQYGQSRGTLSP